MEKVKAQYRYVFIIEDRNVWEYHKTACDPKLDLVLCIDFGLYNALIELDYNVNFLDHFADKATLDKGNLSLNYFLRNWFKAPDGKDLLTYNGFNIGDALLLNVLNDVTYFYHFFCNIIQLKKITYHKLFVGLFDKEIEEILNYSEIKYNILEKPSEKGNFSVYSFPISKWIEQAINRTSIKNRIADILSKTLDYFLLGIDFFKKNTKKTIYIQNYFPTKQIIQHIIKNGNYNLVLSNYIKEESIFKQRRINLKHSNNISSSIIDSFKSAKKQDFKYDGYLLNDYLFKKVNTQVELNTSNALSVIKSITEFFAKRQLHLMIPITNLWLNNRLLMNYCKNNDIPVFMIINGLLNISHWEDAHDSDYVNCYSESLREDYFGSKSGVYAIGDPRMDKYANLKNKEVNVKQPNIVIGTAGFDNIDLNSYLAFEFDFLFDVLKALENVKQTNYTNQIILKVRSNGYSSLYENFVKEYFEGLKIRIEQEIPFFDLIKEADLYISFYSQSIMEAAALGIPTIYYKKDTQTIFRPYDGNSELITVYTIEELTRKIIGFYNEDPEFNSFLKKEVLENYIGYLDGKNEDRNIEFIHKILGKNNSW